MPCGCKKKAKRGSGSRLLGRKRTTWAPKQGSGYRRKRRKKASGMAFAGAGMSFRGSGVVFDGAGFKPLVGRSSR